jgi:DnaJ-class molecular chaperone
MKRKREVLDPVTCWGCNGSGEGMADGLRCMICGGSGDLVEDEKDPDEY